MPVQRLPKFQGYTTLKRFSDLTYSSWNILLTPEMFCSFVLVTKSLCLPFPDQTDDSVTFSIHCYNCAQFSYFRSYCSNSYLNFILRNLPEKMLTIWSYLLNSILPMSVSFIVVLSQQESEIKFQFVNQHPTTIYIKQMLNSVSNSSADKPFKGHFKLCINFSQLEK